MRVKNRTSCDVRHISCPRRCVVLPQRNASWTTFASFWLILITFKDEVWSKGRFSPQNAQSRGQAACDVFRSRWRNHTFYLRRQRFSDHNGRGQRMFYITLGIIHVWFFHIHRVMSLQINEKTACLLWSSRWALLCRRNNVWWCEDIRISLEIMRLPRRERKTLKGLQNSSRVD